MENQNREAAQVDDLLELEMLLGQNEAFGFLGGRCSAAQAKSIRRLRNQKLYKVAAAVSETRRSLPSKKPVRELGLDERIARLDRLCSTIIDELSAIPRSLEEPTIILKSALVRLHAALTQFRNEFGF